MKNIKEKAKSFIVKHGAMITSFAFAFVVIAANSSCCFPYFEPEEPKGLDNFKMFSKQN